MSRNPFIFLGHFNVVESKEHKGKFEIVAIPSFSQGISTLNKGYRHKKQQYGSQSLHFLRAFQQNISGIDRLCNQSSRNPFIFLGHFNGRSDILEKNISSRSQSLHFLRAFQQKLKWKREREKKLVAIPSFSQGISTGGPDVCIYKVYEESQSLHFLRAFQLLEQLTEKKLEPVCRNPFIFLGHFNKI